MSAESDHIELSVVLPHELIESAICNVAKC
jgi:hypothetical protein